MCRLSPILLLVALCSFNTAFAQLFWIPGISFQNSRAASVYSLVGNGKPLILAVGNVHTPASERLFESGLLQDLSSRHCAQAGNLRFSTNDLQVAFMNVRVIAGEALVHAHEGIPVMNVDESDAALNAAGWQQMYSITGTGLFLVTPDHLVYRLSGSNAEDVYTEARRFSSKLHPGALPDVRLLDVAAAGHAIGVSIQNFSTAPLRYLEVCMLKNGKQVRKVEYNVLLTSLEATTIDVPLEQEDAHGALTVIVKTVGDSNPTNNQWSGFVDSGSTDMIASGGVSR